MSEEKKAIELELPPQTPDLSAEAPAAPSLDLGGAAAAVQAAPAPAAVQTEEAPAAPTLTLEMPGEEKKAEEEPAAPYLADANLSEAEQKVVDEFSEKIDLKDSGIVLQYGAAAQKKVSEFADSALEGVKTKDLGEVGGMITDLVAELKGFSVDETEKKGLFGRVKKKVADFAKLKAKYDTAEANVDRIVAALEGHQNTLSKDIVMLDKMYDSNLEYFKELTMYIIAGKKKLAREQETTLAELRRKAAASGLAEDAQAANDFAALCDRFDKKLYDLELTRTISMQMAPQIRLVQNSDTLMVEKIQSTISNTIPLWKNQMVLALGVAHSQQAMQAQREVNELTNELIKKNAETLKTGSIEIAKESERGIIDMETVRASNERLIETLDEVVRIQEEGRQKRRDAEAELGKIEAELKKKLLDIRNAEGKPVA